MPRGAPFRVRGPEITLVPHQHDDDVGLRVVAELVQPSLARLEGGVLGDVVHQQSAHRSPILRQR
eukprot:scaffold7927_cov296-Pinguiococcus_pyrenoidosus.AAC.2